MTCWVWVLSTFVYTSLPGVRYLCIRMMHLMLLKVNTKTGIRRKGTCAAVSQSVSQSQQRRVKMMRDTYIRGRRCTVGTKTQNSSDSDDDCPTSNRNDDDDARYHAIFLCVYEIAAASDKGYISFLARARVCASLFRFTYAAVHRRRIREDDVAQLLH